MFEIVISEKPFSLASIAHNMLKPKGSSILAPGKLFFMGRDALEFGLNCLGIDYRSNVLLPAYTCFENLTPFIKRKAKITFYDINENLEVDIRNIEELIENNNVSVFMWINYFGKVQSNVRELKSKYGMKVVFIEDCSHSLLSQGSGLTGDIVFASLRKILPMPDGGFIKSAMFRDVETHYKPRLLSDLGSLLVILKSTTIFKKLEFSRRSISSLKPNKTGSVRSKNYLDMSSISRKILSQQDFGCITEFRRNLYESWELRLKDYNVTKVMESLNGGVCPSGFPIIVNKRDLIVEKLKQQNIFLKLDWQWSNLADPNLKISYELSRNSITLPIHQDINERCIELIVDRLARVLGSDWSYERSFRY